MLFRVKPPYTLLAPPLPKAKAGRLQTLAASGAWANVGYIPPYAPGKPLDDVLSLNWLVHASDGRRRSGTVFVQVHTDGDGAWEVTGAHNRLDVRGGF